MLDISHIIFFIFQKSCISLFDFLIFGIDLPKNDAEWLSDPTYTFAPRLILSTTIFSVGNGRLIGCLIPDKLY